MRRFSNDEFYFATDDAMRLFGTSGSLALRRHRGQGPPFFKIGRRVLYLGKDLNKFIDSRRVEPRPPDRHAA